MSVLGKIFLGNRIELRGGVPIFHCVLVRVFVPYEDREGVLRGIIVNNDENDGHIWPYVMGKKGQKSDWGKLDFLRHVVIPIRSAFRLIDAGCQCLNVIIRWIYWLCVDTLKTNQELNIVEKIILKILIPVLAVITVLTRLLTGISHFIFAPRDTFKKLFRSSEEENFLESFSDSDSDYEVKAEQESDQRSRRFSSTASLMESLGESEELEECNFNDEGQEIPSKLETNSILSGTASMTETENGSIENNCSIDQELTHQRVCMVYSVPSI